MNHSILKLLPFIIIKFPLQRKNVIPYSFPNNNPVWFTPKHWNAFAKTSFFSTGLPFPRVRVSLCASFTSPVLKFIIKLSHFCGGIYWITHSPECHVSLSRSAPDRANCCVSRVGQKFPKNPLPLRTGLGLGGKTRPNAKWKFMRCRGPPQIIHPSPALS